MLDRGAVVDVVVVARLAVVLDVAAGRGGDGGLAFRDVVVVVVVVAAVVGAAGALVLELVDVDAAWPPQAATPSTTKAAPLAVRARSPGRQWMGLRVRRVGMAIRTDAAVCRRPRTAGLPG